MWFGLQDQCRFFRPSLRFGCTRLEVSRRTAAAAALVAGAAVSAALHAQREHEDIWDAASAAAEHAALVRARKEVYTY